MLKGIINFFKGNDDELDAIEARLDALEKAADERIAAKEAILKQLNQSCDERQKNIEVLQENVARYQKAINQRSQIAPPNNNPLVVSQGAIF
jgi:uncharacterized coiled-coil protein SlyX